MATEQERATKAKPEGEPKKPVSDQGDSTSKPFKVLKVGGREIPVSSEEELIALAQKGADYTRKTQALADERRDAEAKLKQTESTLEEKAEKMNALLDRLVASGIVPGKLSGASKGSEDTEGGQSVDKVAEEDLSVFKQYDMDPASAYPHEKKIVMKLAAVEEELNRFKLRDATVTIDAAIAEERENFPYDDIKDDQGQDVTKKQFSAVMLAKKNMSGIERPTIDQIEKWARESVREIHDSQRKPAPEISEDMDPQEFLKRYPSLAKRLRETAVEENDREREKVPPSIKPAMKPADLRGRQPGITKGKSLDEFLDAGFSDPDIIKALNGGG